MENNKVDNRSASQKINDIENALMSLYQTADNMVRDLTTIKEAIKLLGNKVESIVKASLNGEAPTDEVINRIMVQNNCDDLAQKVSNMVAQGILIPQETISDDSFIVGSEVNDKGETENPRLQFALLTLTPEVREKIKGGKSGDLITVQEGKLKFQINEVYQIKQPKAPETLQTPKENTEDKVQEQVATA